MKRLILILSTFLIIYLNLHAEIVIPQNVYASSTLTDSKESDKYSSKNLCDCSWKTWVEGEKGDGIGTRIVYEFSTPLYFGQFHIRNGYGNVAYYFKNNRVKEIEYFFDNSPLTYQLLLEDTCEEQIFKITDTEKHSKITFTIKSVYKGTEYDDTCISELAVQDSEIEMYYNSYNNSLNPWFHSDSYRGLLLYKMNTMEGEQNCRLDKTGRLLLFRNDYETGSEWYYPEDSLSGVVPCKTVWGTNEKIYEYYRIYLSASNNPLLIIHHYDDHGHKSDIDCYYFDGNNWIKDNKNEAVLEIFNYAQALKKEKLFPHYKIVDIYDDNSPIQKPDTFIITPLYFKEYPDTAPLMFGERKEPVLFIYDGKKFKLTQ